MYIETMNAHAPPCACINDVDWTSLRVRAMHVKGLILQKVA